MENIKYLTVEGTPLIATLYKRISEIIDSPEKSNQACNDKAHKYLLSLSEYECIEKLQIANQVNVDIDDSISNIPKTIKVRCESEEFIRLSEFYKKAFGLTRMRLSHYSRIILTAYLLHLQEERKKLNIDEDLLKGINDNQHKNTSSFMSFDDFKNLESIDNKLDAIYDLLIKIYKRC